MKRLRNKIDKIIGLMGYIPNDLFFQALPEENKRDYYKMKDAAKTFFDNLPQK